MTKQKERRANLTAAILSLSLLTVMAGAAVAPALDVIKTYFSDANQIFIQMIISIPSLFIALTSFIFPKLCRILRAKELVMLGLMLYVVGGCAAGLFSNIFIVLVFRALVGVGVGIIMPLSTGLISFYYTRDKQDKLMGLSSAMNQMGGVIATLISGILAAISWRASFLVYLLGLISIVLCLKFLPNERIATGGEKKERGIFKKNFCFIGAIFLLMFTFFIYPSVFAIETVQEGVIPPQFIAVIMAGMDFAAFIGGLAFAGIKKRIGIMTKIISPLFFLAGYILLLAVGGWIGTVIGSLLVGFANGIGIPFIISTASQRAGKTAATTVMPLISMSLYTAQFTTPLILNTLTGILGGLISNHISYAIAAGAAVLFLLWSLAIRNASPKDTVIQEH